MPSGLAGGPIYRRRCRLAGTVVEAGNVQPRPHINVMWIRIEGPRRSRVERGREPRCGGVALLTTKTVPLPVGGCGRCSHSRQGGGARRSRSQRVA